MSSWTCLRVLPAQGITLEKKEARAEKEEAERYQKLQQELVSQELRIVSALQNCAIGGTRLLNENA